MKLLFMWHILYFSTVGTQTSRPGTDTRHVLADQTQWRPSAPNQAQWRQSCYCQPAAYKACESCPHTTHTFMIMCIAHIFVLLFTHQIINDTFLWHLKVYYFTRCNFLSYRTSMHTFVSIVMWMRS